jgi:hypothetical protein
MLWDWSHNLDILWDSTINQFDSLKSTYMTKNNQTIDNQTKYNHKLHDSF